MNVLVVSRCLPYPLHHGDRLILHHLLTELAARGHRCDVIAFAQPSDDASNQERSARLCHALEVIPERPRSLLQFATRLVHPFPREAAACWNPQMWRAIASRLASRAYDVAHLFGGIQVFEFREIVRRLPCLIAPYESHSLFLSRALRDARTFAERARTAAALVVARRYERVIFRGYDRVVVVADADREALSRLSPGLRVCVIPNGVQVDAGVSASRSRPAATLVFVGNYAYVPNQRAALALVTGVLPRVKAQVPEAQLLLVGAAPPAALQRLARADVEVTGQVPDVRPYLARATCFVAPMTQGAGLKNKVLEAMAAGVPVVTTPLGAGGLAVRDGEHLLIGGDAVGLAQAVVRLLRDPSLQHRLGTAGQQLVRERYSWAEAAARYEALYRETIAEREARR